MFKRSVLTNILCNLTKTQIPGLLIFKTKDISVILAFVVYSFKLVTSAVRISLPSLLIILVFCLVASLPCVCHV